MLPTLRCYVVVCMFMLMLTCKYMYACLCQGALVYMYRYMYMYVCTQHVIHLRVYITHIHVLDTSPHCVCLQETEQALKRELGLEGASQMDTSSSNSPQLTTVSQRSVPHPLPCQQAVLCVTELHCTCTCI